jgi:hypothetical protein
VITGAMRAAALRGVHGPSTEHVLLALAERSAIAQLLRELGIDDATALVDAAHPRSREPLQLGAIELDARMALAGSPPSPGPIPPLFERFSVQAQGAVASGIWFARELESGCVEPAHLLIGLLRSNDGVIAGVQQAHEPEFQAAAARAAGLLSVAAPASGTGIFTPAARTLVAEDALAVAHRLGDPRACLSSAHLLLAAMGSDDAKVLEALSLLGDRAALAAELAAALPGEERMSL